jgi:hypothetical protein
MGESFILSGGTARSREEAARCRDLGLPPAESKALAHFADSGRVVEGENPEDISAALASAHKTLLLAWNLEERRREIRWLRKQFAGEWAKLHAVLYEKDSPLPEAVPEAEYPQDPWQTSLAAMAAFIPDNAVLVTGHTAMREYLLENNMLRPLPEALAAMLPDWDATLLSSILWTRLPLQHLTGTGSRSTDWLRRDHDLLVIPDSGKGEA